MRSPVLALALALSLALAAGAAPAACSSSSSSNGAGPGDAGGGDVEAGASDGPVLTEDDVRINQLQLKASHNSYHVAMPNQTLAAYDYTHQPLDVQLASEGVRGFELDTHLNADGTFDVYHEPTGDDRSTCPKLKDCLGTLKAWSDAHPHHHTIFVSIEPKDVEGFPADSGPELEVYAQKLEAEVTSVIPRERLITPADVKGSAATLREAVTQSGWPTLRAGRQKFVFYLDESTTFHDVYTHGNTSLDGRLMFIDGAITDPYAAIVIRNDPRSDAPDIQTALAANLIVRTRADADTVEARAGDTSRRDAALAIGAQIVSTDYEAAVAGINYVVDVPGGAPSRCNPVNAPAGCTSTLIEDPATP